MKRLIRSTTVTANKVSEGDWYSIEEQLIDYLKDTLTTKLKKKEFDLDDSYIESSDPFGTNPKLVIQIIVYKPKGGPEDQLYNSYQSFYLEPRYYDEDEDGPLSFDDYLCNGKAEIDEFVRDLRV
jgi:hypothetical protein